MLRRAMRQAVVYAAVVTGGLVGCGRADAARTDNTNASFAGYDAGAVAGGPGRGTSYAIGHVANDSLVHAMNVDVGQDGGELPAGRGSVADGAVVYAAQCAQCHGAKGEGMTGFPKLVGRDSSAREFQFATEAKGKTIGNYWPYASTIFDYVKRAMPLAAPGSLSNDQVYAITAYLLAANAIIADTVTLDAASLRRVRMPARDKFIVDNRAPNGSTP